MRIVFIALCWLSWAASSPALASAPMQYFTLDNGLEVVVVPNHRVPAVAHIMWYRVGGADDPKGKSGLAHFLEHMMFQGTKTLKPGEYAETIARLGGKQNAFTSYDVTGYYAIIAKEHLETVMKLEADRMQAITPDEEQIAREREVILEERSARIDNYPQAQLAEAMQAAMYLHYPYQRPLIGWRHEMEGLNRDDVLTFFERYYHPGNAVLVLSGDITEEEAKPLAEQYYGGIAPGPDVSRSREVEPPHLASRRVTLVHEKVGKPQFSRDYLAPTYGWGDEAQIIPLDIAAEMLGGGKTSHLYQRLVVERKLATGVSAGYSAFLLGPGAFSVSATPADGVSIESLEAAVDEELAAFLSGKLDEDAFARAKIQMKADTIYAREGLFTMGRIAGYVRMLELPLSYIVKWPEAVENVTIEHVRNALNSTLNMNHSVTGVLLPEAYTAKKEKPDAIH